VPSPLTRGLPDVPDEGPAMTEAELLTRRALQESLDLREQGHSDD
jgi:hypothetical protein